MLARAVPVWKSTHLPIEGLLRNREPDRLRNNLRALCGSSQGVANQLVVFLCSTCFRVVGHLEVLVK